MKRLVVGLAGGVGSGKSTVASFFRKKGARIVDADAIGHHVLDRPRVRAQLVKVWGPSILRKGRVDRPALARTAFRTRQSIDRLNRIVHPAILRVMAREIAGARSWVVLDAALLFESGLDALCDRVVFVSAPRATRSRRVRAARGWGKGELRRRERFQWPASTKKKRADYVVDNTGPKSRTKKQLRNIYDEFRSME